MDGPLWRRGRRHLSSISLRPRIPHSHTHSTRANKFKFNGTEENARKVRIPMQIGSAGRERDERDDHLNGTRDYYHDNCLAEPRTEQG
ncbi:unnamed protein product [Leptosia nina]|uniref:Uncharacterized protein n=1 Tax=Leptosia nina TaxID=320188 RepID=A0AAV1IYK8_9NEOP